MGTTNSPLACSLTSESLPAALSATMPLPITDSKIARLHASLDGARVAASTAPSQHRMTLPHAPDLQPALHSLAWTSSLLDWLWPSDTFQFLQFFSIPWLFCW